MIEACRQFGACIQFIAEGELIIKGVAGKLSIKPGCCIESGNSGQVLRYITAIMATQPHEVTVTGDDSICSNRPISPYLDSFNELGVKCESIYNNGYAPVKVCGPVTSREITVDGSDSQIVTGLCIAATLLEGDTVINVINPGETPWVDVTLSWLKQLGVSYQQRGYSQFVITGKVIDAFDYSVPADFSSAAFPVAAAMLTRSPVTVMGLNWDDVQGDKQLFYELEKVCDGLSIDGDTGKVHVNNQFSMHGCKLDINHYIDSVTILAVLATQASGPVEITNAAIARKKECDRITAITNELSKMGAQITSRSDGLIVYPGSLEGGHVESHGDHRIAMSLSVAGLIAKRQTIINNTECVNKSYPGFVETMKRLGADIKVIA